MNPIAVAFSVAVPAAFVAGVIFHKYVISEAEAIKAHVTTQANVVRNDVATALSKLAAKV